MLTVWGRRDSSNVQAVMWTIGELGLPVHRIDAGHRFGGTKTPEFLAMNPNGLVPVLRDGDGAPMFESAAIIRYLAARYGSAPFWPDDPVARAPVDQWAEWARLNVAVPFTQQVFTPLVRTPSAERDTAAVARFMAGFPRTLAIAEARLAAQPWLAGDDFTVADIQCGYMLYRYFTLPIDRPDLPALQRYYERLQARPAFAEHVMVSYAALQAA